jgi:hypothetical protein
MGGDNISPSSAWEVLDDAGVGVRDDKNRERGSQGEKNRKIGMFAEGNKRLRRAV